MLSVMFLSKRKMNTKSDTKCWLSCSPGRLFVFFSVITHLTSLVRLTQQGCITFFLPLAESSGVYLTGPRTRWPQWTRCIKHFTDNRFPHCVCVSKQVKVAQLIRKKRKQTNRRWSSDVSHFLSSCRMQRKHSESLLPPAAEIKQM